MAVEFATPTVATVKVKLNTEDGGYVHEKDSEASIKGYKLVSMAGIKADANVDEATAVFNAFYGVIGNVSFDSLSAVKVTTQEVDV